MERYDENTVTEGRQRENSAPTKPSDNCRNLGIGHNIHPSLTQLLARACVAIPRDILVKSTASKATAVRSINNLARMQGRLKS